MKALEFRSTYMFIFMYFDSKTIVSYTFRFFFIFIVALMHHNHIIRWAVGHSYMTQSSHVRSDNQIYRARNEFLNEPIPNVSIKAFFVSFSSLKQKKTNFILIINLSTSSIFFVSLWNPKWYTVHHFCCACVRTNHIYLCLQLTMYTKNDKDQFQKQIPYYTTR